MIPDLNKCFILFVVWSFLSTILLSDEPVRSSWKSFDSSHFPFSKWPSKEKLKPNAVLIGVHGFSGAASDFNNLGAHLSNQGVSLYAYELRGQGNDPEESSVGDIVSVEHWYKDLNSFIKKVHKETPEAPIFLYGESLGSLIVMHGFPYLDDFIREKIKGVIYASPLIALPGELPPVKNFIVRIAMFLFPKMKISIRSLASNQNTKVTSETDHWEQMAKTPHFVPKYTLRALGSIEALVYSSKEAGPKISKPTLILYPGKDVFTRPDQVDEFFGILKFKDKTKYLFKESHHLLAFDKEKNKLFNIVEKWIKDRS